MTLKNVFATWLSMAMIIGLLTACQTTTPQYYKPTYKVPDIPYELMTCKDQKVVLPPKGSKVTQKDVANLLGNYETALRSCKMSENAIKDFLEKAKKEIEANQS
jgi:hypothetical protein